MNQNQDTELEEYKTDQQYQSSLKYKIEEPEAHTNLPPQQNNGLTQEQQKRVEERRRLEAGRDRTLTLGRAPVNQQAAPPRSDQELQDEQMRRDMELARQTQQEERGDVVTDQHVNQTKNELKLVAGFNAICGIAFTVVMFMQTEQVGMLARAKGQRQVMFAVANCMLYMFTALQSIYIIQRLNQENLRSLRCRHQFVTFVVFLFTFSAIGIVWSEEMEQIKKQSGDRLKPILTILDWMVWVRLAPIILQCVILVFVCCFICGHVALGRRDLHERTEERLNRLPGVKSFLKNRSRSFKPSASEKDKKIAKDNEGCAICLDDFAEGDGKANGKEVVDLQCGHIFHAKCMEEWVENNDICPMCREPILQK